MWKRTAAGLVLAALLVMGSTRCGESAPSAESRNVQEQTLTRAFDAVPPNPPGAFPGREAINESMRQTAIRGPWYTYILNFDGTPVTYFVSEFAPMSLCDSISATDYVDDYNDLVRGAPSLDGIYRAGSDCRTFQVMTTAGNYIRMNPGQMPWISTRQPIRLETDITQLEIAD